MEDTEEEETISILYIDDEQDNLRNFKANFRFDYDITLVTSAQDALDTLKTKSVHIIIADQKMPGMTGVEFFDAIKDLYSSPIRILLTAYADIDAAIDAINKGNVFRFIKKPWDEHEIRMSVKNGYEVFKTKRDLHLRNQELQKINKELNRFVYSASHELKAPLLSIKGLLTVAKLEGNAKDSDKYFSLITRSVNQLEGFITNIISYYKNLNLDSHLTEINFLEVVQEVLTSYEAYYYSKQINYNIKVSTTNRIISDAFRIRVIVNNILSNAIKYQNPEEANKKIDIKVEEVENKATLIIKDNGIGIGKEYLNDIYNMFYRATTQNSGSGIGLYIVKEAVDKINGDIQVESEEGKGTKFTVTIPSLNTPG